MNALITHHKFHALYITFVFFSPLMFLLFSSVVFFKLDFQPREESFSLAMKQFVSTPASQVMPTTQPPTPVVSKPEPIIKPIKKHHHKKKHIRKEVIAQPVPSVVNTNENVASVANEVSSQGPSLESFSQSDDNAFLRKMRKAIESVREYPRQARKMHLEGVVTIEFLWKENKSLGYVKILKSSGHKVLDENAIASIKKAANFFPYYKNDARITMPIAYSLIK
ncbi:MULTISPECIES: energy transducer TonB [unclassified Campylobacter]|uniref:energy transducer TonB n=1 Tax=unclassified Campylobacter TaxID=2593542 RepID=UPI001237E033|nr:MULTISPECIES: energy transducer TonB [unclassified Campylobacter]KAA6225162.1 energy transducer TonB [Campylobacter sp. LR196d]KAA6226175.1 energy transducer TonB [Campylobacter sp. LR185c]KAA6228124.1 energy transducer TonB [Campylobacter sp. LR286c]KAA6231375.1 energy transducer TonB [Campylobacter sp. LR264d]KAA6231588.1 energy transducer TonB [Campylobacter sp. LR291e]